MGTRKIVIELDEEDCQWLEHVYGDSWKKRMEQHIRNEIRLRSHDALKMREPWDY
jgi:hypothetical protein